MIFLLLKKNEFRNGVQTVFSPRLSIKSPLHFRSSLSLKIPGFLVNPREMVMVLNKKSVYEPVPANIYLSKINNRNTRKKCEICSELTIKVPERRQ